MYSANDETEGCSDGFSGTGKTALIGFPFRFCDIFQH